MAAVCDTLRGDGYWDALNRIGGGGHAHALPCALADPAESAIIAAIAHRGNSVSESNVQPATVATLVRFMFLLVAF